MDCQALMKWDVVFVLEDDTVQTAALRMRAWNVGFLPVLDAGHRPVGVITDRDLALRVCAENRDASETRARAVMTPHVLACRRRDDLCECARLMEAHCASRIVVVEDDGRLAGVISLSDMVEHDSSAAARTMRQVVAREMRDA